MRFNDDHAIEFTKTVRRFDEQRQHGRRRQRQFLGHVVQQLQLVHHKLDERLPAHEFVLAAEFQRQHADLVELGGRRHGRHVDGRSRRRRRQLHGRRLHGLRLEHELVHGLQRHPGRQPDGRSRRRRLAQ